MCCCEIIRNYYTRRLGPLIGRDLPNSPKRNQTKEGKAKQGHRNGCRDSVRGCRDDIESGLTIVGITTASDSVTATVGALSVDSRDLSSGILVEADWTLAMC